MIVGVMGKKGSGKSTLANYLVEHYNFVELTFAEPLKKICKELFSLSDEQLNDPVLKEIKDDRWGKTPREILQYVGTDLFREHYDEYIWVKILKEKIRSLPPNQNIVISDIRHQNELDLVTDFANSETVFVFRIVNEKTELIVDSHKTENNQLEYSDIQTITNNSTKESFYETIKKCCKLN